MLAGPLFGRPSGAKFQRLAGLWLLVHVSDCRPWIVGLAPSLDPLWGQLAGAVASIMCDGKWPIMFSGRRAGIIFMFGGHRLAVRGQQDGGDSLGNLSIESAWVLFLMQTTRACVICAGMVPVGAVLISWDFVSTLASLLKGKLCNGMFHCVIQV